MEFNMQNQKTSQIFNKEHATSFDKQIAKLAPMREALHLLIRVILSELPAEAKILCIGVGTGTELIYLAKAFPQWQFTAVDPAASMLNICRQQAEEGGFASRCTFHEGYLDSLPESAPFDAATSLLVSQFLVEAEERRRFFRQIAARLRPGGYLLNADLAATMSDSTYASLFDVWQRTLTYSGMPKEQVEKFVAFKDLAVLPPHEVEAIIASSGFDNPVLFLQTILIHAWYAKRAV
jgi:tRNA (cmo5U34)-methyltransferase